MKKHKILSIPLFVTIYVCLIGICILLDQLTKFWIYEGLLCGGTSNEHSVKVLGNFMTFTPILNSGAAFGLGQDDGANIIFFVITIVGTPLFAYLLWRSRTRSVCGQVGFAFIVGGTIGNAIDRAYYAASDQFFSGRVRDFIKFSFFPPVFNVADSFLTIGVVLALIAIVFLDYDSLLGVIKKEHTAKATPQNDTAVQQTQPLDDDNATATAENADNENPLQQDANGNPDSAETSDENH